MGCFGRTGKSSKRSETKNKNNDFAKHNKLEIDANCVRKSADRDSQTHPSSEGSPCGDDVNKEVPSEEDQFSLDAKDSNVEDEVSGKKAMTFAFEELSVSTGNFRSDCLLGEGGFGKVYKGLIERINQQVVAIKQLDRNGAQGIREFVVEVMTLNLPNGKTPLSWNNRMKIAAGAARGLEYLHDTMKPPVIYRDLKCSNILLGEDYHPKLSDFGLAKARPLFKDRKNFKNMVDPLMEGDYPVRGLYQALAIAAMCVQDQPGMRPVISDVVMALDHLASCNYDATHRDKQTNVIETRVDNEEKRVTESKGNHCVTG
ncbi:hypothetical protein Bca4012_002795 [Brassica carinata]